MTRFNIQEQTRASRRHSSRWSPRPLIIVVLTTLLFVAPVRGVGAANSAGGHGGGAASGFGGGRGGGTQGGFNGGHMGAGHAGHENLGQGHGGRTGGGFRGHDFERRGFHHFDDGLGLYIFPGSPYYDYEPYEPYVYDPYCNEDSPSYDPRY